MGPSKCQMGIILGCQIKPNNWQMISIDDDDISLSHKNDYFDNVKNKWYDYPFTSIISFCYFTVNFVIKTFLPQVMSFNLVPLSFS